jgi:Transcription termination factor nusG
LRSLSQRPFLQICAAQRVHLPDCDRFWPAITHAIGDGSTRAIATALPDLLAAEHAGAVMSYWACAQLEANREHLALHCLSSLAGYRIYLPRIRVRRLTQARKLSAQTVALFPGHAFVLVELQWHAARWTPGVLRVVLDGVQPARPPDKVIADLKGRERDGLVELHLLRAFSVVIRCASCAESSRDSWRCSRASGHTSASRCCFSCWDGSNWRSAILRRFELRRRSRRILVCCYPWRYS